MTPRNGWRRPWWLRRVRAAGEDRGATLLLALIFITVISVAVVAMLTVAFANLRATTALREQAAAAAAADGAAQIAINALRLGSFTGPGDPCFGTSGTLELPNLAGGSISAAVECTRDNPKSSLPGPPPSFPYALVALPARTGPSNSENGITISVNGVGNSNLVSLIGDVRSNGPVQFDHGHTSITNGVLSAPDCDINNPATVSVNGVELNRSNPDPAYCKVNPGATDPNLTLPPGTFPEGAAAPPTYTSTSGGSQTGCNSNTAKVTFTPGIYSNVSMLNNATNNNNCPAQVVYDFRPGVYWFAFDNGSGDGNNSSNLWRVTRGTLVAGSAAPLAAAPVTIFPTSACDAAGDTSGVTFVFGNHAQWSIGGARVQVCGRLPASSPPDAQPLAIYGLKSPNGIGAQTGCVTRYTSGGGSSPCDFLEITGNNTQVYVRGVTYAPLAWVNVSLSNTFQGSFVGGVVARRIDLRGTGGVRLTAPFATAPPSSEARTVVHLTVYLCPGASTCSSATGRRYLTATVGLNDPSGAPVPGQRQVTVYGWNAIT